MSKTKNLIIFSLVYFVFILVFSSLIGFGAGYLAQNHNFVLTKFLDSKFNNKIESLAEKKVVNVKEESAVIEVVKKVSPAVVSIIVTKDLPKMERYYVNPFGDDFFGNFFGNDFLIPQYRQNGTEKKEIGGGTGFIISKDGYIVTNKHVVSDLEAEYTVLMNDEKKYPAKVIARDPVNDLAVLKIEAKDLPTVELGDSSKLEVGQTVIAIGNALGEFRNTVSVGVISGLSRSITAAGVGIGSEQLIGVIQTDASINPGNSGGPLLNIAGQVIGINTAVAQGAQGIGFAIPINSVKNSIKSAKENGEIVRPWLGVRYVMINEQIAKENNLKVNYGALIVRGERITDLAVIPGSPADKAGLQENDIILEVDGQKVNQEHQLLAIISQHQPGDELEFKILHKGEEKQIKIKLDKMK